MGLNNWSDSQIGQVKDFALFIWTSFSTFSDRVLAAFRKVNISVGGDETSLAIELQRNVAVIFFRATDSAN